MVYTLPEIKKIYKKLYILQDINLSIYHFNVGIILNIQSSEMYIKNGSSKNTDDSLLWPGFDFLESKSVSQTVYTTGTVGNSLRSQAALLTHVI